MKPSSHGMGLEQLAFLLKATPVIKATAKNDLKELRVAVQHYPNIDAQENGETALMIGAAAGFDACVRELLSRNACVYKQNKVGKTALMMAISKNHIECVRALLRVSPTEQLKQKDQAGKTAFDYCLQKHTEMVALLDAYRQPKTRSPIPSSLATSSAPSGRMHSSSPTPSSQPNTPMGFRGSNPGSSAHPSPLGLQPTSLCAPPAALGHHPQAPSIYPPNPDPAYNYVLLPPVPQHAQSTSQHQPQHIPPQFICSITTSLMQHPVVAADGHTYEQSAIEEWFFRGSQTSPLTGLQLPSTHLIPNLNLRSAIQEFLDSSSGRVG